MKITILSSAINDIKDGLVFYENQKKCIGAYFSDSIISDIDSLLIYHGIHEKVHGKYLRNLSKRFSFAIYYSLQENNIIVKAILDCRKNPEWLRKKLK